MLDFEFCCAGHEATKCIKDSNFKEKKKNTTSWV